MRRLSTARSFQMYWNAMRASPWASKLHFSVYDRGRRRGRRTLPPLSDARHAGQCAQKAAAAGDAMATPPDSSTGAPVHQRPASSTAGGAGARLPRPPLPRSPVSPSAPCGKPTDPGLCRPVSGNSRSGLSGRMFLRYICWQSPNRGGKTKEREPKGVSLRLKL